MNVDLLPPDTPHAASTLAPRAGVGAAGETTPLSDISRQTIDKLRQVMADQGVYSATPLTSDSRKCLHINFLES